MTVVNTIRHYLTYLYSMGCVGKVTDDSSFMKKTYGEMSENEALPELGFEIVAGMEISSYLRSAM